VGSFLTVGRRPEGGYKGRMLLREAYERLEWDTPLAFERAGLRTAAAHGHGPRNVGTSAHMLIELYLDMERAHRVGGYQVGAPEFVVLCKDPAQGRYLRRWLQTIHGTLQLDVDVSRVRLLPLDMNMDRLRGVQFYSWAVFCDHAIKDNDRERNLGPYRLVRKVEKEGEDRWVAYDRDANRVCRLTKKGMDDLANATTCPLTIEERPGTGVTYPAYQGSVPFNAQVLLRRSFRR